ncbi:CRISPR-associated protein Cas6 [Syntrophobotulus glycolicus DSM 8271]|uniref:CRISPR-associated protein Cas6 n=1 Tax=Syntrophobotulus glycolicus (strain DSM 8271 / FlGlyR) TaxID=645991 RepID=F0SWC2_SYNGF|nr:CRISPR-associated endoribonuclease Cas6 [Syntrophobotulus glycolicus]ADY55688.1 CRISPR-associated protein Cas6 [Syntrophobotulus glycolicus DSM 8271]
MRIKVELETKEETLPLNYREKFLSYLKKIFEDHNRDIYQALYSSGANYKPLCSAIYFRPEVEIVKTGITLKSKRFVATFTTRDVMMGVHLINALLSRRNHWAPLADTGNQLKITAVTKVREHEMTDTAAFRILSPVVVRDHDQKEGRDWYLTFEDKLFEAVWKRNLKSELRTVLGRDAGHDVDGLNIKPIQLRKTVVLCYSIYLPCTIGTFALEGEPYLLDYLYKSGLGSKRSLGFGCLDIL